MGAVLRGTGVSHSARSYFPFCAPPPAPRGAPPPPPRPPGHPHPAPRTPCAGLSPHRESRPRESTPLCVPTVHARHEKQKCVSTLSPPSPSPPWAQRQDHSAFHSIQRRWTRETAHTHPHNLGCNRSPPGLTQQRPEFWSSGRTESRLPHPASSVWPGCRRSASPSPPRPRQSTRAP